MVNLFTFGIRNQEGTSQFGRPYVLCSHLRLTVEDGSKVFDILPLVTGDLGFYHVGGRRTSESYLFGVRGLRLNTRVCILDMGRFGIPFSTDPEPLSEECGRTGSTPCISVPNTTSKLQTGRLKTRPYSRQQG